MIWITLIVTIGGIVAFTRWCDYRTDVARAKYQSRRSETEENGNDTSR